MKAPDFDVVIVGGGIIGCACGFFLSASGASVCIIEKGALGTGASKSGQTHVILWEEPDRLGIELAIKSNELYRQLAQTLPIDIEYRKTGSLSILDTEDQLTAFSRTVNYLRAEGINAELLTADELRKREPNLTPKIAGGAVFHDDAQVNPLLTTLALAQGAQENGAEIRTMTSIEDIKLDNNKTVVEAVVTNKGIISTQNVIIAAGAWSGQIGKLMDLQIPVRPRKGHLIVTVPVPDSILRNKIVLAGGYLDLLGDSKSDVAIAVNVQQTRNGNLLIGSSREFVGFDTCVNPDIVSQIVQRALTYFPWLKNVEAMRMWAGLRPHCDDMKPIIGPVEGMSGVFIATGFGGIGITMAPITGKILSDLVIKNMSEIDIGELSLNRFHH